MKLHRVVLYYTDTEEAFEWFVGLGFPFLRCQEDTYWFELGEAALMLRPKVGRTEVDDLMTIHVAVPDVLAVFRLARRLGFQPFDHLSDRFDEALREPVRRPWGEVEFNLLDPGGYLWAFTQADAG